MKLIKICGILFFCCNTESTVHRSFYRGFFVMELCVSFIKGNGHYSYVGVNSHNECFCHDRVN